MEEKRAARLQKEMQEPKKNPLVADAEAHEHDVSFSQRRMLAVGWLARARSLKMRSSAPIKIYELARRDTRDALAAAPSPSPSVH
jgi:hypothetical protein